MDKKEQNETHDVKPKNEEAVLTELAKDGIDIPVKDIDAILKSLPDEERQLIISTFYAIEESSSFRGPLPPPDVLKGYEETLAGASERILAMAEKQQNHRMRIEATIVDRQTKQSAYGQIWGGCLAGALILIALVLGMTDHDVLAGIIATTTITSVLVIFVLNKTPKNKDKEDKENDD